MDAALMLGIALSGMALQKRKGGGKRRNGRRERTAEEHEQEELRRLRNFMPSFARPLAVLPTKVHPPRKTPASRYRKGTQVDARQDRTVRELMDFAADVQRAHYNDSAAPARSGVFDPMSGPMLVDLPREKTQRLNTPMKQLKLEMFTGNMDGDFSRTGVWRHKTESEPRFSPLESAAAVTSSGSAGNPGGPAWNRARMPEAQLTVNNVLPGEQVQVGRGVGVDPEVPAADGFHPYYRTLPGAGALGSYKKNQLPGGIIPGKAPVDVRESQFYRVGAYRPPKFFDMKRRPLAATMARVTAPTSHADEPREVCGGAKVPSEEYFGHPALVNGVDGPGAGVDISHATREGFTERSIDGAPPVLGAAPGRVPAPATGAGQNYYDDGRFEKLHSYGGIGPELAGPPEAAVKSGYVDKSDQAPQPTLRERPSWLTYVGIAAPTRATGTTNQHATKQLDRHAKRGDQLVLDYQSNPLLKRPDVLTFGEFAYSKLEKGGRLMGVPGIQGAVTSPARDLDAIGFTPLAISTNVDRAPRIDADRARGTRTSVENPRAADLDIARRQLQTNPFNHAFVNTPAARMQAAGLPNPLVAPRKASIPQRERERRLRQQRRQR